MNQRLTLNKNQNSLNQIRILHIDSEKQFLELTRDQLNRLMDNIMITSLSSLSNLDAIVGLKEFDLIISNSLEPINSVRKWEIPIPFVVFSEADGGDMAVRAVNLGVDYFLPKGDSSEIVFRKLSSIISRLVHENRLLLSKNAQARSNQLMIDSFPNIMALISFKAREIVASNKAARLIGAEPGTRCFEHFFGRNGQCPWCKTPELEKDSEDQYIEVVKMGKQWACYWFYVSEEYYMHYIEDVTKKQILIEEWENQQKKTIRAN
ncbi:MAG: hypothetical protein ACFFE8_06680 [Candidatus Heimdallarchaeota archaeon]